MKHLLLILTFVASTVVVKAQTKDETIAWIKEMLEKAGEYNGSHYTNVQVSPCSIRFRQVYDDKNKPDYYDISFNPSKVMTGTFDMVQVICIQILMS